MKFNPKLTLFTLAAFLATPLFAQSTVNIGTGGGFFAPIVKFLQEIVDFMAGPFGLAAAVIVLVFAIVAWMAASRMEGTVGYLFRGFIGLVAILNIATFVTAATG